MDVAHVYRVVLEPAIDRRAVVFRGLEHRLPVWVGAQPGVGRLAVEVAADREIAVGRRLDLGVGGKIGSVESGLFLRLRAVFVDLLGQRRRSYGNVVVIEATDVLA